MPRLSLTPIPAPVVPLAYTAAQDARAVLSKVRAGLDRNATTAADAVVIFGTCDPNVAAGNLANANAVPPGCRPLVAPLDGTPAGRIKSISDLDMCPYLVIARILGTAPLDVLVSGDGEAGAASLIVDASQLYGDAATDLDISVDTTLDAQSFFCRRFWVRAGVTLTVQGLFFVVRANVSAIVEAGGRIVCDGNGAQDTGDAGSNSATGGHGGNGGAGGVGALPGVGTSFTTRTDFDGLSAFLYGWGVGSAGGTGGPETDTSVDPGGLGGRGGGMALLTAPEVQVLGSIFARGLDGTDAPSGLLARGGGGSGGGGSITLWGGSITLGAAAVLDVSAGATAGASTNGGASGSLGTAGEVHKHGSVTQL